MKTYKFKYREFAEALYDALIPDPFYITLENQVQGDSLMKKEAMLRYFDYSMIESEVYGSLCIPDEHKYGVSIWSKPMDGNLERKMKSEKKEFLLNHLGQSALDSYLSIVDFMSDKATILAQSNPWYLSIVGLKPSFQNKGLGAGLIEPILRESDKQGIITYLETFTPRNITFYERLGYTAIDSFHEPVTNSPYWIMQRIPQ